MLLSGTLTKAQLIDAVAEKNGFTRKKSIETVEILPEPIKQSCFQVDSCSLLYLSIFLL